MGRPAQTGLALFIAELQIRVGHGKLQLKRTLLLKSGSKVREWLHKPLTMDPPGRKTR